MENKPYTPTRKYKNRISSLLRGRRTAVYVGASSLFVMLLQLTPFLSLNAQEFGYYSIIQLIYILGTSTSLSLINEADFRLSRDSQIKSDWKDFSAISFWVSILFATIAIAVTWNIPALRNWSLLAALIVGTAVYRGTVRYRLVHEKLIKRLIFGDLLGVLAYISSGFWFYFSFQSEFGLREILLTWMIGQGLSTLFTRFPRSINPVRALKWIKNRRKQIGVLAPDSALQDVGSVWGPTFIAIVLDIISLGIYRAVTTVAAPIRLVLTPLRPLLAGQSLTKQYTWGSFGKVSLTAFCLGSVSIFVLLAVEVTGYRIGVLNDLAPFALPVGLYVASNFINFFYSVQARVTLPATKLLLTRALQAVSLGLAPVLFATVLGLSGAIWGLGIGSAILSVMWIFMLKTYGNASLKVKI